MITDSIEVRLNIIINFIIWLCVYVLTYSTWLNLKTSVNDSANVFVLRWSSIFTAQFKYDTILRTRQH